MTEVFTGVRVFDGHALLDGTWDLTVDDGVIGSVDPAAVDRPHVDGTVDGTGCTLLPGLVDAHVHLRSPDDLADLARWGITTALDMGTWPAALVDELRRVGPTDVRSSGPGAVGPGSVTAGLPDRPADSIVPDPSGARSFVEARAAEGADFIKVIVDPPGRGGLEPATVGAIVAAAHERGLRVVAHASNSWAVAVAQSAGVDVLTHAPLDRAMTGDEVAAARDAGRTSVPTLIMMRGVAANVPVPGLDYGHARDTVTALHRGGVPIVLGTDANQAPGVPANVRYGESAHQELELLVEAGLTPIEALRAATSVTADRFGLVDRGRIAPGARADLLLVEGDPTTDITVTRRTRAVRVAGRPA